MTEQLEKMYLLELLHKLKKKEQELGLLQDECQMQFLRKVDRDTAHYELEMKYAEVQQARNRVNRQLQSIDFRN